LTGRGFGIISESVSGLSLRNDTHRIRLSIIIPVYNRPEYLDDCIGSVLGQLPDDCECVVVDDGSSPDAVLALKRYESAHAAANLRVFYEAHGGASCARNHGLDVARGEFVCFLDGDDRLHEGFLRQGREHLEGEQDLVIFAIDRVENGTAVRWPLRSAVFGSPGEFADRYLVDRHLLVYSQCNKFYRKSIIDRYGIRFDPSMAFGEDRLFNFAYIPKCGRIVTSSLCMIDYVGRGGETMSTRHVPDFARKQLLLNDAKTKTFLGLSVKASESARRAFAQYGLSRVVEESVERFAAHPEEVPESLPILNRIIFGDFTDDGSSADVLIIPGSRDCRYRVEKALEVGRRNAETVYVVSGGNPSLDGSLTEAEFMRSFLVGSGVSTDRVILENRAVSTAENIRFSLPLIGPDVSRIGIVSGAFHMPRAREIVRAEMGGAAEKVRYYPAYGLHTSPDVWYRDPQYVRLILEEIRKRRGA